MPIDQLPPRATSPEMLAQMLAFNIVNRQYVMGTYNVSFVSRALDIIQSTPYLRDAYLNNNPNQNQNNNNNKKQPPVIPFDPNKNSNSGGSGGSGGSGASAAASAIKQYQLIARQFGLEITSAMGQKLLAGQVAAGEWQDRLTADERLRNDPQLRQELKQVFKDNGKPPPNESQLLNYFVGAAPRDWYNMVNEAQIRFAFKQADQGIPNKAEVSLGKGIPTGLSQAQIGAGTVKLVNYIKMMPASKYRGIGLTRSDLIQAVYGGPRQAAAVAKLQQAQAEEQAFAAQRAAPQMVETAQGPRQLGLGGLSGPTTQ